MSVKINDDPRHTSVIQFDALRVRREEHAFCKCCVEREAFRDLLELHHYEILSVLSNEVTDTGRKVIVATAAVGGWALVTKGQRLEYGARRIGWLVAEYADIQQNYKDEALKVLLSGVQCNFQILANEYLHNPLGMIAGEVESFFKQRDGLDAHMTKQWGSYIFPPTDTAALFKNHFARSQDLIRQGAKGLSGRVVIFGPGKVERALIPEFTEQFGEVLLCDAHQYTLCQDMDYLPATRGIKRRYLDLTGRLEAIADIFRRVWEETGGKGIPPEGRTKRVGAILKAMELIMTTGLTPSQLGEIVKTIGAGTVDYCVSSLVYSQLPTCITQFACSEIDALYAAGGEGDKDDEETDVYARELDTLHRRLSLLMVNEQFSILNQVLKPRGRAYIADTLCKVLPNGSLIKVDLLPMGVFGELSPYRSKRESWIKFRHPDGKTLVHNFEVEARIITTDKEPLFCCALHRPQNPSLATSTQCLVSSCF